MRLRVSVKLESLSILDFPDSDAAGSPGRTMRALILEAPGRLALSRVPVPEPSFGEVLVQIKAATTCGTDLKAYLRGHPQIPTPSVFGHEYSGVVAAAGVGATFLLGEAVMGVHSAPCQQCRWCLKGQENLCESIMSTKVLGSFAEYLLIPARIAQLNLFSKPQSLSFEAASLLEPLACVMQAILNLGSKPFDSVLVIGPGAIGLMFVSALKARGFTNVTLVGRNPQRLAVGRTLGANSLPLAELSDGAGFDLTIECTGSVEVWERALALTNRGGTALLFGGCPGGTKASFDTKKLHYDQIDILSPFHFGTQAVQEARALLLTPGFDLSPVLSGVRTLEEGPRAFEELKSGVGIKYVLKP